MLTATQHRRRRSLGAIKTPALTYNRLTLAPPSYTDGTSGWYGGEPDVLPPPPPPGGGGTNTPSPALQQLWFTAAVGPTAGNVDTGGTQPPMPTTPAGAAISTTSGSNGQVPVAPSDGGSSTPVSTEPMATVEVGPDVMTSPVKRWWPWAVGAAVLTAVGAYVMSR